MDIHIKEENSSFGIQKILDVKITNDGKQMYKVRWEPTWEPAENLVTCQHLIDEFWSFVNIAKVNRENTPSFNSYPSMNSAAKISKLSEDDKSDVQRLIARTNQTPTGNPTLISPNMLFNQQHQQTMNTTMNSSVFQKPTTSDTPNQAFPPDQKGLVVPKTESSYTPSKGKSSYNSTLKYLENFDNPYVKIIVVCKVCNKEQNPKFSFDWKRHYLGHVSDEEKPHKCPHCPKAFVTLAQKRKHLKTHENAMQSNVKEEGFL